MSFIIALCSNAASLYGQNEFSGAYLTKFVQLGWKFWLLLAYQRTVFTFYIYIFTHLHHILHYNMTLSQK